MEMGIDLALFHRQLLGGIYHDTTGDTDKQHEADWQSTSVDLLVFSDIRWYRNMVHALCGDACRRHRARATLQLASHDRNCLHRSGRHFSHYLDQYRATRKKKRINSILMLAQDPRVDLFKALDDILPER